MFAAIGKEPPDSTSQSSDGISSPLYFPAMLLIFPAIGADTAADPKDAEASEEVNPADSDDDGGDSESLFGGMCFSSHFPLPVVYLIVPAMRR